MLTSKMTTKGQVTIPVSLRRKLGVEPADRVVFVEKEDAILVKKIPDVGELYGSLENKKVKALSVEEMEEMVEEMSEGEI